MIDDIIQGMGKMEVFNWGRGKEVNVEKREWRKDKSYRNVMKSFLCQYYAQ